jgi:hypothetical protein
VEYHQAILWILRKHPNQDGGFGNHLGSTSLELDEQAQIISYEEHAPYGGSGWLTSRKYDGDRFLKRRMLALQ